jgi:ABC-2 type transport system permease protein
VQTTTVATSGRTATRGRAAGAVLAQTAVEVRLTLRRGENLLVTLLIPAAVLLAFGGFEKPPAGYTRTVDFLLPGVLALAIMSAGMVSLSIATAYERFYRVLKRLGATPLSRFDLIAAKIGGVLVVEALQIVVLTALGAIMGWRPAASTWAAVPLLAAGTVCFAGIGLLMAGALRAEATLALANTLYLAFLAVGGIVAPLNRLPGWLADVVRLLPATALARALRAVMTLGTAPSALDLAVLVVWSAGVVYLASRTFRWE